MLGCKLFLGAISITPCLLTPSTVYQGLIPWAWIEASTKGAVLLFVASEAEYYAKSFGAGDFVGGISGGMAGGVAQAYATMGFCTCMKTVEITKHKIAAKGVKPPGTFETFMDIWRKEGIRGINKGVNAVAIRQTTNWGSRFGLSRLAESAIRNVTGKEEGQKLGSMEKILASGIGGGLSAWNQPIEVIRVEMQSKTEDPNRPKNLTVGKTLRYIYSNNGIKGLYRGVTPRIGLGVWQTICMVALGDMYVFLCSGFGSLLIHMIGQRRLWRSSRVRRSQPSTSFICGVPALVVFVLTSIAGFLLGAPSLASCMLHK